MAPESGDPSRLSVAQGFQVILRNPGGRRIPHTRAFLVQKGMEEGEGDMAVGRAQPNKKGLVVRGRARLRPKGGPAHTFAALLS